MASRFVQPEPRTLTLANGDTLIVRARLTAGETRAQLQRAYIKDGEGAWVRHPLLSGLGLVVAYLLDWHLTEGGLPIRELGPDELATVLDNLDVDSFAEIKNAIEAHEAAMRAERLEQKKTAGEGGS